MHDLLSDERYTWRGNWNWVRLDPSVQPAHILRFERAYWLSRAARGALVWREEPAN